MIVPDGKNKKYIEVVSGLYILYVILNPILGLDRNFRVEDLKNKIYELTSSSAVSQDSVARNYILGLENSLKEKIESKGYLVDYIQFYITSDYSSIVKIEVKLKGKYDENKIKEIILEDFEIDSENIKIY